ncbi:MAG: nitronate monooxygenase, partial [Gemmatimonadaceae bacterium]|nr:nitronate monooxygenase [Gemmatimonadaceae bacterium]
MAGCQGSALAIAARAAGAVGSLPCAMLDPDTIVREVATIRAAGDGVLNLNFFCHAMPAPDAAREAAWRAVLAPAFAALGVPPDARDGATRLPFGEAHAALVERLRPELVSFHFGLPSPALLDRVRASGARIVSSATTVAEAAWLAAHGADAIIAQGLEAGGHRGHFLRGDLRHQQPLATLLPAIVAAVRLPVVAAGGIATAHDVRAARRAGAIAVQVGTALLRTPEATTTAVHRAALHDASTSPDHDAATAITNIFTGRPARALVNRAMRDLGALRDDVPAFPHAAAVMHPLRVAAESAGRGDYSPLWSGSVPAAAHERPAAEIIAALAAGID